MIRAFFRRCGETQGEQHAAAYELLYAAASFCGREISADDVKKTEQGKPYVEGSPEIYISISHSGEYAAVLISDVPCGIDIEKIKDISERVSKRYLGSATGQEALIRWTERESYGKLEGGGFFSGETIPNEAEFRYFSDDGYLVTVCFIGNETEVPLYCLCDGEFVSRGSMVSRCAINSLGD